MKDNRFLNKYKDYNIVFFDGNCALCQFSVQFIIKNNKDNNIYFISQSSKIAKNFLKDNQLDNLDALIFFSQNRIFTFSDAAIEIAKYLDGWYKYMHILIYIPKPIRDTIYKIVAKIRYKLFSKKDSCMILSKEQSFRFLDN